jgi:uncharacterized membrane protein YbhN (UPF0104 family)
MIQSLLDWFESVWDQITALSFGVFVLVAIFQIGQTVFNGVAWRGILGYAFPGKGRVSMRKTVAAYAGGIGLNNILPAQAGTVTYLTLFKTSIEDSTIGGVLGGAVVQNVFYTFMQVLIYATIIITGWADVSSTADQTNAQPVVDWMQAHKGLTLVLVVGGLALIVVAVRLLWRKIHGFLADAGGAAKMLFHPGIYVPRTLLPQILAYVCRIVVIGIFMHSFDIPVTAQNIALVIAATSLASTFAVTPGGVGTTQAAVAFVLAPQGISTSTATAYSLSQQLVTTAINIGFGLLAMGTTFGWDATKGMVKRGRKGETQSMADLRTEAAAEGGSGAEDAAEPARLDSEP